MLELDSLDVGYRHRCVLSDINGQFGYGIHALLGSNGAGKSTLFKTVAGFIPPLSGDVAAEGRVGLLPQDNLPKSRLTVSEQLSYLQWLHKVESDAEFHRVADLCDLGDMLESKIKDLSGGMRRRVGIACSLIGSPDVLLLDEPSAGLDIVQRTSLKKLIAAIARDTVVLYSTHIVSDLMDLAETVSVVGGGKWLFSGSMDEFMGNGGADSSRAEERYLHILGASA